MHYQETVPDHLEAVKRLPKGGLVLSVDNFDTLREAKGVNPGIITAARHYSDQRFSDDYPVAVEIARAYFGSFVSNRTYLEQHAPFVDLVLDFNEYYDTGMALNDPEVLKARITTATAMANVWNDEYRGRRVRASDGGEGLIPASCRLVIGNGPVGNDTPEAIARLAIATHNVIGYHPYLHCSVRIFPDTIRDPGCWRYHSGRWHFQEQAWGLSPDWCFTEGMPYMSDAQGWRNWLCLAGDALLLRQMYRLWLEDLATTPAFKQNRIIGWTGAWFTIGGGGQFGDYLLEAPQLIALADTAAAFGPRPGTEIPPMPDPAIPLRKILANLDEVRTQLAAHVPPDHTLANLTNNQVFTLFKKAFGPEYFQLVVVACDEAYMLDHRTTLYIGKSIEEMPGLDDVQKDALIAALAA